MQALASKIQHDVRAIIQMAEQGSADGIDLEGNYGLEELQDMVATMRKLMQVRDVVLTVNRAYVRSASQAEEFRTEPPFKPQGSYRNMNRIAERVLPILNDTELHALIVSSYESDAQTLTTGAEANLLKFKEMLGILSSEAAERWASIKKTYQRHITLRGMGADNQVVQIVLALTQLTEHLNAIHRVIADHTHRLPTDAAGNGHASVELVPPDTSVDRYQQDIQIINRVPRVLLGIIQQQFNLMQAWLHPLQQATNANDQRVKRRSCPLTMAKAARDPAVSPVP